MFGLLQIAVSAALAFGAVGQNAPDFSAKSLTGQNFNRESLQGRVVLIHFWATWCTACMQEMPAFIAYYKKHRGEGFEVLAVNMDSNEGDAKSRAADFPFPVVMQKDGNFKKFGRIWHLPMTFLIDRKGILREDDWNGDQGIDQTALEKTVTPLLGVKP